MNSYIDAGDPSIIVGVVVVGFNHERGNEVEWVYPSDCEIAKDDEFLKDVVFLALPDQAHQQERSYCYFSRGAYFGISCFQQISIEDVIEKTQDMTRSYIQKSVCVIARRAFFGAIKQLLDPAVRVYFAQGAFKDRIILEKCYALLRSQFFTAPPLCDLTPIAGSRSSLAPPMSPLKQGPRYDSPTFLSEDEDDDVLLGTPPSSPPISRLEDIPLSPSSPMRTHGLNHPKLKSANVMSGVRLRWFIRTFGRNALVLFKLLFLEVRVGYFAPQVADECEAILCAVALMPLALEKLCARYERQATPEELFMQVMNARGTALHQPEKLSPPSPAKQAPPVEVDEDEADFQEVDHSTPLSYKHILTDQNSDDDADENETEERLRKEQIDREEFELQQRFLTKLLPLQIFRDCYFSPYTSLHLVDEMSMQSSFLIGSTNALFVHNTAMVSMDVLVNMQTNSVEFRNGAVQKAADLTMEDKVFIDFIIDSVGTHDTDEHLSDGVGSEHWIRHMFFDYTLSLMCTIVDVQYTPAKMHEWNAEFVRLWINSVHFSLFRTYLESSMLPPGGGNNKGLHPGVTIETGSLMGRGVAALHSVNRAMHQFGKSKFVKGISSFLSPDPVKIDKKTALKLDLAKKDEGKNEDELTLNHELPDISPRRSNSWNDDEEEEWVSTEGTVKAVLPPQSPERESFWGKVGGWFSNVGKKLDDLTEGFEADHHGHKK